MSEGKRSSIQEVMARVLKGPPKPNAEPQVPAAEFIALRSIVMSLVAVIAAKTEESGENSAQGWLNHISAVCQESLLSGDISGPDSERIRREAMEHVNHILGAIRFENDSRDNSN